MITGHDRTPSPRVAEWLKIMGSRTATSASAALRRAWDWWKPIAMKIGNFQARVLLALFYALIFAPFALAVQLGSDPLAIKPASSRGWWPRRDPEGTPMEHALRQF